MAGLELIFSTICNATICDVLYDKSPIDPVNLAKQNELLALKNEVNGKHLKIGTYNNYPMSWVERLENGTLVGRGVAFVIVDILREKFNFTYEVVTPEKNFLLGDRRSADSLLGLVNSSKIDMAAAFFPILLKYNEIVTYSDDLDEGVWMMMLKRPKESAAGSGLLAPFDTYVWCVVCSSCRRNLIYTCCIVYAYLILAAVLTYGPFITLITWIRSKLIQNDEDYISLSPSTWFVYGAFIKQGTSLSPEANTTRVSFATWWLFVMLLSAFYTANLTAFLTLSKFTLDIENPIDLYKKNYRWVTSEGGAVQYTIKNPEEDLYYLNKMILNRRAQIRSVNDNKEFLPMVTGGAVLVKEQTAVDELMYSDYLNKTRKGVPETQRCTYVMAPNPFMKKQRAFAYPRNSTLNKLFDTVLKYLIQSGIVDHLERRDLPSTRICPLDLQSKDRQLRNADLMMTYFIIIAGLSIASAAFVSELIVTRYYKKRDEDVTLKTKTGKASKMSKGDDGRPPPYDSLFGKSRYKINEILDTRIINGREYYVVHNKNGDTRLIPVRSPSAFLYR